MSRKIEGWNKWPDVKPPEPGMYAVFNGKDRFWFACTYSSVGSFDGWHCPNIKMWTDIDMPENMEQVIEETRKQRNEQWKPINK